MPTKCKQDKKAGTSFDLTTNSDIEKNETILMKSRIRISQLNVKILLRQRSLNQIRHYFTEHNHI